MMNAIQNTYLPLLEVLFVFCLTFVAIPFALMGFKLKDGNWMYKVFASLSVSILTCITLVFALAFLGVLNRWTFALSLLLISLAGFCVFRREHALHIFKSTLRFFDLRSRGLIKSRFVWRDIRRYVRERMHTISQHLRENPMSFLAFSIAMLFALYIRWYFPIRQSSFLFSDQYLHTDWLVQMLNGKVFVEGVYPFGLHNVAASLSLLYDINPVILMRFLSCAYTIFLLLGLYMTLQRVCKTKAAVNIGFIAYTISALIAEHAYYRQSGTLPQEFGMVFVLPCVVFFIDYLQHGRTRDLVFMCACLTLTATLHFYNTIILLVLMVCIALFYWKRIFKKKTLISLAIAACCVLVVTFLPYAISLLKGIPPHGSFAWAVRAMGASTKGGGVAQPVLRIIDKIKNFDTEYFNAVFPYFLFAVALAFVGIIHSARLLLTTRKGIDASERNHALTMSSFALYSLALIIICLMPFVGLPALIEYMRSAIYFSFNLPFLVAIAVDAFAQPLKKLLKEKRWLSHIDAVACSAIAVALIFTFAQRPSTDIRCYQYPGAVNAYFEILRKYSGTNICIISSDKERPMIRNYGWHYEMLELVHDLSLREKKKVVAIPSEHLFFFIEKHPLDGDGLWTTDENNNIVRVPPTPLPSQQDIEADALALRKSLPLLTDFYTKGEYRRVIMGKAMVWMQEYMETCLEMKVFYEDDDLIVFHLQQNDPYALFNLSIDYGYN